jgi:hypothetical protein
VKESVRENVIFAPFAVRPPVSACWLAKVKRTGGKKQPLSFAAFHALRDEYTRTIEPPRALAAESLTVERVLNNLVHQAYGLTPPRSP